VTSPPPDSAGPAAPFVRRTEQGIEISVKVVPGASRPGIAGVLGNRLKVRVAEPPEGGKANRAVERLIADWLGVRGARVVAGHGRPEKTVAVPGIQKVPEDCLASALKAKK
jgi:uncharacterized protein (TIGR00251 family)